MGYHALTKPVLFFAAGNIHQTFHSLEFRVIGPGVVKVLPVTAVLMSLAALAAIGLPPFGLFLSEMTIISGALAAQQTTVGFLIVIALLASFCGILQQLTRILLGARKPSDHITDARRMDGVPAMALLLGGLLFFSVWLPAPLLELLRQAAGIIGGNP
jgi:hydrogenase-4 component F